jgi:FKBP-type peptidyl-prolyl cis-trans isomerase
MNFKRLIFLAALFIAAGMLTTSCNTDYPGYKKTKTGIYYKIYTKDNQDTTSVSVGKIVNLNLKYGLKDSTLFDSKEMPTPIQLPVIESQYEGDFYEALQLFKQGDSASFVLKAGQFFTKTFGQPTVPDFMTDETDLYFYVTINKSQTEEEINQETEIRNQQLEQEEMVKLQAFIQSNGITVQPSEKGVYYIETKKGTGKSPATDTYASVHFSVNLLGGDRLFSTYDSGEPVEFKMGSQFENMGFQEAVSMMKEGGKANAIVPSSMAFGPNGAGNVVPPFATLYYDLELVDVMTNEEYDKKQQQFEAKKEADMAKLVKEEDAAIQKFLKDNNLTPKTILPSGLVYIENQAGTGAKPADGKKVKVHYTGKLLNGTVFDSSIERGQPIEFVLGRRQVIEGWDTGIALMNEGAKGILVIPSRLAYKDRAQGNSIPPNSTLVFDVELVETEK